MCADHCIWSSISKCKHKRNNSSYVVSQIMYGPYISFVSFFQCKQKEINWFWEIVVHQEFMQLEIIFNMITMLYHTTKDWSYIFFHWFFLYFIFWERTLMCDKNKIENIKYWMVDNVLSIDKKKFYWRKANTKTRSD